MAVAQVGALISFVDATTIVHSDFNSNFTDLRTAFNNLVTGANQLAGGISVNGALTVVSSGITVTGSSTISGLVTVGALASGSIASGFGTINNASNSLTTGAITATTCALSDALTITKVAVCATFTGGSADQSFQLINTDAGGRSYNFTSGATASGNGTGFYLYDVTASTRRWLMDAAGLFTVDGGISTTTVTTSGIVSVDDTTETTSGTDGSIHTDGGVGIAKKLYVAGVATLAGGIIISDNVTRVGSQTTDSGTPEDTNENTLQTVNIAANDMGTNGGVRIIARGQVTGSANTKTVRLKFGASTVSDVIFAAGETGSYYITATAFNRNSASAQVWWGFEYEEAVISEISIITSAVDTTAQVAVTLTGQTADAADEITAELLAVELIKD